MDQSATRNGNISGPVPTRRNWSFRWRGGPEQVAEGPTAAVAALSLGYGFDDFKDLTWEERR